jgi:uncharacterized protein DUF2510
MRHLPKADWYPDPSGRNGYRYWDGAEWTDQVATDGRAMVDPLGRGDSRPSPHAEDAYAYASSWPPPRHHRRFSLHRGS